VKTWVAPAIHRFADADPVGAGDAAAPEATPTARLFIAVWPSAAVRAELQAWLRRWRWPAGAAVVAGERLHLTLHFLGQVPLARLPMLTAAMADAAAGATRCELAFERVEHWPHGLVVLRASADSAPLARLHAALGASLRQIGLAPQARPYRAHVTLARRAAGAEAPPAGLPQRRWVVDHCALVHSERGYRDLLRCPLGA